MIFVERDGRDKTDSRVGVNGARLGISIKGLAFRRNGLEGTTSAA